MFNSEAEAFYAEVTKKNIGVYTKEEQDKLKNSKVIIFGLGGVGGMEAILCARLGIGYIGGVDPDTFELSNINRQMLATTTTIDKEKSIVTETHLKEINPFLTTNFHNVKVTEDNVGELMQGYDVVLDALDDMPSRIVIHRAAKKLGLPSIAMSGSPPHRGFVATFLPQGIAYEDALNMGTNAMSMSELNNIDFVQQMKKKRAQYSVSCGAPQSWADDFCNNKAGWIITPIRATLLASFSCHEVAQVLLGKPPLATAPTAIYIDMDNIKNPVTVINPECGYWDAYKI